MTTVLGGQSCRRGETGRATLHLPCEPLVSKESTKPSPEASRPSWPDPLRFCPGNRSTDRSPPARAALTNATDAAGTTRQFKQPFRSPEVQGQGASHALYGEAPISLWAHRDRDHAAVSSYEDTTPIGLGLPCMTSRHLN